MRIFGFIVVLQLWGHARASIRSGAVANKLVKAVGHHASQKFVPLTEFPIPHNHPHLRSGRRHFEDDCSDKPDVREVKDGGKVDIIGDYYDDGVAKTVATVIIPDHIDHKHFQVTSQEPYLTVGPIEAIGYHPATIKGDHPSECEKIYQDHLEDQYSEEDQDYSEESLEVARMPLVPTGHIRASMEHRYEKMYEDYERIR